MTWNDVVLGLACVSLGMVLENRFEGETARMIQDVLQLLTWTVVGVACAYALRKRRKGCSHRVVTFPVRDPDGVDRSSCLKCGQTINYWELTKCDWLN